MLSCQMQPDAVAHEAQFTVAATPWGRGGSVWRATHE